MRVLARMADRAWLWFPIARIFYYIYWRCGVCCVFFCNAKVSPRIWYIRSSLASAMLVPTRKIGQHIYTISYRVSNVTHLCTPPPTPPLHHIYTDSYAIYVWSMSAAAVAFVECARVGSQQQQRRRFIKCWSSSFNPIRFWCRAHRSQQ